MIPIGMKETAFHPFTRALAKVFSFLFHPLFVPVYVGWFFIYVARLFPEQDSWHQTLLLITFFVNYTVLPLATILLAKGLGFIQSIYLRTQKDRIIPYIATGVFYFWVWYVFKNQKYPEEVVAFGLAVFLASTLGLILNIYFKISMHMLAMGVVVALLLMMAYKTGVNYSIYLSIGLLMAGVVGTARMINNDHHPFEIYAGFFAGMLSLLIASFFV